MCHGVFFPFAILTLAFYGAFIELGMETSIREGFTV